MFASCNGYLSIVNRLLECKCLREDIDINLQDDDGFTALIHASKYGYLNIVNRLLECKDIDVNFQTDDFW